VSGMEIKVKVHMGENLGQKGVVTGGCSSGVKLCSFEVY
jgi:hypothetical protein